MTPAGTSRIYLAIIALLVLVIAAMAYKFIVAGSTLPAADGRVVVVLDPGERALLLREMRGFVAGLQQVSDALARDDMQTVAQASRAMGTAAAHGVPVEMLARLPLEFKKLAFGVHGGFDALAAQADRGATPAVALRELGGILGSCVACHAIYQVAPGAPAPAPTR
ncbi:MAG TPA: hypothetical protein VKT00_03875 [Casimicrobiaceae bacterium]|nr:hypothetical protein [Casimicrobiaceae bacterium]